MTRKVGRKDVEVYYVPATRIAEENGMKTLANMIITGKVLKEVGGFSMDNAEAALEKVVSARHRDLLTVNAKAVAIGYEFEE